MFTRRFPTRKALSAFALVTSGVDGPRTNWSSAACAVVLVALAPEVAGLRVVLPCVTRRYVKQHSARPDATKINPTNENKVASLVGTMAMPRRASTGALPYRIAVRNERISMIVVATRELSGDAPDRCAAPMPKMHAMLAPQSVRVPT